MENQPLRHPDKERIGEIRARINEAKQGGPLDRGELRDEVSRSEMADDNILPEVMARAVNRYISEYEVGSDKVRGGFETVHGAVPETGVVVRKIRHLFPDMTDRDIFDLIGGVEADIAARAEENPDLTRATIVRNLQVENSDDEKLLAVLRIKDRVDEGTNDIARRASQSVDCSLSISSRSRLMVDLNRASDSRTVALEYSLGGREVQWYLLEQSLRHSCDFNDDDKITDPYLLFSVHGKSVKETPDLVIGGRVGKETSLVDPEIARWLKQKLEEKIVQAGMMTKDGKEIVVGISREGEQYSGEYHPAGFRYGDKKHQGFGELLQFIQLEIDKGIRGTQEGRKAIAEILADIMRDFNVEFDSADSFNNYIESSRAPEDTDRLNGIYHVISVRSNKIKHGKVGLSSRWRRVLNVNIGDTLEISGRSFEVDKGDLAYNRDRVLVFSDKEDVPDMVVVKSK